MEFTGKVTSANGLKPRGVSCFISTVISLHYAAPHSHIEPHNKHTHLFPARADSTFSSMPGPDLFVQVGKVKFAPTAIKQSCTDTYSTGRRGGEGAEMGYASIAHKNTQNMISHNKSTGCPISTEGLQLLPCRWHPQLSPNQAATDTQCQTESEEELLVYHTAGRSSFYSLIMRNNHHSNVLNKLELLKNCS